MFANTKMVTKHTYNEIGGFCPNCHHYEPIGDVIVSAVINFRPDASTENISIHHCSLMNMKNESIGFAPFIEIICPECGGRMIQIDDKMSDAICNFNNSGFFTKASCDGLDSYSQGYISFFDISRIYELIIRTDKFIQHKFTFENEPYIYFSSKDKGYYHPVMSLIFDTNSNAIRPFTKEAYWELKGVYINSDAVCDNCTDFIDAVNKFSDFIPKWYENYASHEKTDDMSLSQYIDYINR